MLFTVFAVAVLLVSRGGRVQAQGAAPASVKIKVAVPGSMNSKPFDTDRYLTVPEGFQISVYARVSGARFIAVTPDGNLLVSQPGKGIVSLVQANTDTPPTVSTFVDGLQNPHDMVFHNVGSTTYLYISESNQINRFIYKAGDTTAYDREVVVSNLPDGGNHPLKNIALDSKDKLYVALGSSCNACVEDTTSDPQRGAIYQYDADGKNGRLFAQGLRNAEGLAFVPGTDTLWVVVNNRDNIAYPLKDSTGNYGQVVPDYVDNHPPDEFTQVRDGGNYGWPFCDPNPDTSSKLDNMPFDLDVEYNQDGKVNCDKMDRVNKGIQAHSAPLGVLFLQDTKFAEAYRQGVVVPVHGSWNRTTPIGYKVTYYPWSSDKPGEVVDLVTGWMDNGAAWGRPVDVAVDPTGSMLISDDQSGTIYKLSPQE
jgi:glucose/arabinose dehydrogenase